MILKPCPFCQKEIPRSITVCPYCHRDEQGKSVAMDTSAVEAPVSDKILEHERKELASDDPFIRDQAIIRVAQRGAAVVPALLTILGDFAKSGLAGVARVLGKIGDRRAIPVLAQASKMGDEELRLASVWALAQFHDEEVLPILLAEVERPHPIIQSYIANILGTFQDSRVAPVLIKLAGHPNREVAFQAACALGESGGSAAIGVLKSTWRQGDPLLRSACVASLRRLGSKPSRLAPLSMGLGFAALAALGGGLAWFFYK
jgi:HEAT repeat protein